MMPMKNSASSKSRSGRGGPTDDWVLSVRRSLMIASVAAIVFAVVTSAVVGFQFALALGAPWGAYAMDRHCVVRPATVVLQHYGGRQHRAARLQGYAYRRPAVTRSGDGRGVATAASLPTPDRRRL